MRLSVYSCMCLCTTIYIYMPTQAIMRVYLFICVHVLVRPMHLCMCVNVCIYDRMYVLDRVFIMSVCVCVYV